jgi:hypothetical protein
MFARRFAPLLAPEAGPEGAPAPAGDAAPPPAPASGAKPDDKQADKPADVDGDKAAKPHLDEAKAKLREILDARKAKKEQTQREAEGKELPADVRGKLERLAAIEKAQASRIDKATSALPSDLRARISRVPDLDDREALATALVAQYAAAAAAPSPQAAPPPTAKADPAGVAGGPASAPAAPINIGELLKLKGAAWVERNHPKEWKALLNADGGTTKRTMFSPSKE